MNIPGGWSKSPHFIHDAMSSMSGPEFKCTAVLVRETYGYHRRRARLTYRDFMQQTGIRGKATIATALKAIEARGFFCRTSSPSEWQICDPWDAGEELEGQTEEADDGPNGSDFAANGSSSGAAWGKGDGSGRVDRSITGLERSVSELKGAVSELMRSNAELNRSNGELNRLLVELIRSIAGRNGSPNEPKGWANGSNGAKNSPANVSVNEPRKGAKGTKIEPLPLYKEKRSPSGKEREGGVNKRLPRPRARPRPAGQIRVSSKKSGKATNGSAPPLNDKPPQRPNLPPPRSAAESELAAHPATGTWLEAGMAFPGWERLETITERMGREPQVEMLRKARGMWLMAGYRIANIGGILDWYTALCCDEAWQPFKRRGAQVVPAVKDMNSPQSPSMAMLFKMREEIINGKSTADNRLFDHASISIPPPGSWPADHPGLSAGPG